MVYGDDKSYEMARSLLPSTRRHRARKERALVSRGHRRTQRHLISGVVRGVEDPDDCPMLDADSSREMRFVVWDRRADDKVNPFRRWARKKTQDLPRDSRLPHVRGVLPEGLIGEHALSHLSWDAHFESTAEREIEEARRAAWREKVRAGKPRLDRGLLAQLLRRLLDLPDGQQALNAHIKRACARSWVHKRGRDGKRHVVWHGAGPVRLLLGVHDVLPFLDDIAPVQSRGGGGSTDAQAAHQFLRTFHQQRGNLAATVALMPRGPFPRELYY